MALLTVVLICMDTGEIHLIIQMKAFKISSNDARDLDEFILFSAIKLLMYDNGTFHT